MGSPRRHPPQHRARLHSPTAAEGALGSEAIDLSSWSVREAGKQLNWGLSVNTHTVCARVGFCPRATFVFVKL